MENKKMKIKDLKIEQLEFAANMLKAIAHPLRISIIAQLDEYKSLTVTELHRKLGIEQSATSHHLGILKDKGVLIAKREGKNIYYSLKHFEIRDVINCISKCSC